MNRACLLCRVDISGRHGNAKVCLACSPEWERRRKRAADEAARGTCDECGATLGAGSAWPSKDIRRCAECYRRTENARTEARAHEIEQMWAEGLPIKKIADRLGWTKDHLSVELDRMRRKGFSLPYRHRHHKNPPRYPDLARSA